MIITQRAVTLLLALLFVLACSYQPRRSDQPIGTPPARITENQLAIAGISIGSAEEDVLQAFGTPSDLLDEPDGITGEPSRRLTFPGVQVTLINGAVTNLQCNTPAYATPDSLRVGDAQEKILRLYGVGQRYRVDDQEVVRFNVAGTDTYLVVYLRNGLVTEMHLWFDYT